MGALDKLSDPFSIMTNKHKRQKTNAPGYTPMSNKITVLVFDGDNSPGDNSKPSQNNQMNQYASN